MHFDALADVPLYILIPGVILALALLRHVPVLSRVAVLATWIALAAAAFLTLDRLAPYDPTLARIAAVFSRDAQDVTGGETRVQMAGDGHFWAKVTLNGVERRMLVDSGATVTAVSSATAEAAGLDLRDSPVPVLLRTANGTVRARTATIGEMRIGNVVARDVAAVVAPGMGDVDVIGMNLLSRLKGWRVEGRTLVLTPHHPQAAEEG